MAPQRWATFEQLEFLWLWLAEYLKHQANRSLGRFWPALFEAWFARFSEYPKIGLPHPDAAEAEPLTDAQMVALGEAIKARKKKLANWFRYERAALTRRRRNGTKTGSSESSPSAYRAFSETQPIILREELTEAGYDKINEETAAAEDEDGWIDESESTANTRIKDARKRRMGLRVQVTQRMWAAADPEERAACERLAAEEKLPSTAGAVTSNDGEPTPEQRQMAIDETSDMFGRVNSAYGDRTGWKGIEIWGGPNPRLGGELSIKVICYGTSPAGNTFEEAHPTFRDPVVVPFQKWLKPSFPLHVRRARALQQPNHDSEDEETVPVEHLDGREAPEPSGSKAKKRKAKAKRMAKPAAVKKRNAASVATPLDRSEAAPNPPFDAVQTPAIVAEELTSAPAPSFPATAFPVSSLPPITSISPLVRNGYGPIVPDRFEVDEYGVVAGIIDNPFLPPEDDFGGSEALAAPCRQHNGQKEWVLLEPYHSEPAGSGGAWRYALWCEALAYRPRAFARASTVHGACICFAAPDSAPSGSSRPTPRPMYQGSAFAHTPTTTPTRSPFAPSSLFAAFRNTMGPPPVWPGVSATSTPNPAVSTPPQAVSTPPSRPATSGSVAPTPSRAQSAPTPTVAARVALAAIAVATVMPEATAPSVAATSAVTAPAGGAGVISTTAGSSSSENPVFFESRPRAKIPKVPAQTGGGHGRGRGRGGARAAEGPKRPVGRPRNAAALPTGDAAGTATDPPPANKRPVGRPRKTAPDMGDAAPAGQPLAPRDPNALVHTMGNETRDFNRRVDADKKRREEAAAAEEKRRKEAAEAASDITVHSLPAGDIVIFKRSRAPARRPDGSVAERQVKLTRVEQATQKMEATLLARSAKRRAEEEAAAAGEGAAKKKTKAQGAVGAAWQGGRRAGGVERRVRCGGERGAAESGAGRGALLAGCVEAVWMERSRQAAAGGAAGRAATRRVKRGGERGAATSGAGGREERRARWGVVKLYNSEGGQENAESGRTSKRVIGWRRGR
ncbi:hypothetical protein B0H13DRAFT_2277811 [Mycena leptocephala]|nr:hypothetical protein B0H13DRAFT_2277811 [Mycena leptocephala]